MSEIKYFKNKNRAQQETVNRVTERVRLGVPLKNGFVQTGQKSFVAPISQQQRVNNHELLNVHNNLPQNYNSNQGEVFSTLDDEVIEDEVTTQSQNMYPPLNLQSNQHRNTTSNKNGENDLAEILNSLENGTYVLLVNLEPICSGPISIIEDEISALIFGTHELCDGQKIDLNDVCVVKKINIKVGAFLESDSIVNNY